VYFSFSSSPSKLDPELAQGVATVLSTLAVMFIFKRPSSEPFVASEILPGLYLGSATDAKNLYGLRKHKIKHILNVADDVENFHPDDFTYLRLEVKDMGLDEGISRVFESGISFVKEAHGPVLIHCKYGMNRSATMMIAVVMELTGWTLREAVDHVKAKRPVITPMTDNQRELAAFERKKRGTTDPPLAWKYALDPSYYEDGQKASGETKSS